jgi:hypothetical protein
MTILAAPVFAPVLGEDGASRIVRIVRSFEHCSLSERKEDLAALVGRGVDDSSVVFWQTNCAEFACGVLFAAGCPAAMLAKPIKNGMAFSTLVEVGDDMGAWRDPIKDGPPVPGAVLWYKLGNENDDHAEFLLALPDEHGGGGRANNEITIGHGDFHVSWGRPIHKWLDPASLGLPDAAASGDSEAAGTGNAGTA